MKAFLSSILAWLKKLTATPEPATTEPQPPASPTELPWITIAKKEMGQKEFAGSKHNPRILEYHKTTSLKATEDEVAWCSSFVCWVFTQLKYLTTRSARAKSWLEWGIPLEVPIPGCLVIFTRDGGGHVGFYDSGYKTGLIKVLGGNQSNTVKLSNYTEKNVIGYRWPKEYPLPPGAKVKK